MRVKDALGLLNRGGGGARVRDLGFRMFRSVTVLFRVEGFIACHGGGKPLDPIPKKQAFGNTRVTWTFFQRLCLPRWVWGI